MFAPRFRPASLRFPHAEPSGSRTLQRHPARSYRPALECLEGRLLPSNITWLGTVDSNWSNAANWQNGAVPGPNDTAVFTNNTSTKVSNVDVPFTITGLNIDTNWNGSLTVNSALTLTGSSEWDSGTIDASGGTWRNNGTLTIAGSNPMFRQTLTGTLTNAFVVNLGDFNGSSFRLINGTISNLGPATWNFTTDAGIGTVGGGSLFSNAGTIRKSGGGGASVLNVTLNNAAAAEISVQAGTVRLTDGTLSGGTFTFANNGTLDLTGGSLTPVISGTFTGSGAGTVLLQNGALNIGAGGATFNFPAGLFHWRGGKIIATSTSSLTNANVITCDGFTPVVPEVFLGGTLTNRGTLNIANFNGSELRVLGSMLANQSGGLIDFQNDSYINANGAASLLTNAGTIRKSGGGGSSYLFLPLSNSPQGVLDVRTGFFRLGFGENSTGGTFNVTTGATLDLNYNSVSVLSGTYTGSGGGTIQLTTGLIKVAAGGLTFNFPAGMFQWKGGVIKEGGNGFTNTGTITLNGFNADFPPVLIGTLANPGTLNIANFNGSYFALYTGTVDNQAGGLLNFQTDTSIAAFPSNSGSLVTNEGTVRKSAGSNSYIYVPFNNSAQGVIDVQAGTLHLGGGGTDAGATVTVAANAALDLTNSSLFPTTVTGTYTGSGQGTVQLLGGSLVVGAGGLTLNFPAGMFQWKGGVIDLTFGSVTNTGVITLSGFDGNNPQTVTNGLFTNQGTINNADFNGSYLWLPGGQLDNQAGALIDLQGDNGFSSFFSTDTLTNEGTIRKSAGQGTSFMVMPFTNSGLVDVRSGRLYFASGFTNFAANTLSGGTYQLQGTLQFNGADIRTNAATIVLSGPGAGVVDEFNNNALANLATNAAGASFTIQNGRNFSTAVSFNNQGNLTIGDNTTFTVNGSFTQGSGATLEVQIGGHATSGDFGKLVVTGVANLDGTLKVTLVNGFTPVVGDNYLVMTFASKTGSFAATTGLDLGSVVLDPEYSATGLTLATIAHP